MRIIVLLASLLPFGALASDWVELGKTKEARILLDRASVEIFDGGARAQLKFLYNRKQPPQTISRGKPFDSSINQYHLLCSSRKYQVLRLTVFHRNEPVGSFQQPLNPDDMDQARPDTGVMFLLDRICPPVSPDKLRN